MRVGIAGAGFMAETHLEAYTEMDVDVAAVASPSGPAETIEAFSLEADAYTDVETMCEQAGIDFLDVCTPTHTHLPLAQTAVDAGIDLFLEKPIAATMADAVELRDLYERADSTCMVGHVLRFMPKYRQAESIDIGKPGVARARRLSPFPDWGSDDWFADTEKSGGVFVDLALHDLDYLRWCWGPVERVFARLADGTEGRHGFVTLRFENGAVGYVEASWAQPTGRPLTSELELAGSEGLLEFSSADDEPYVEWDGEDRTVESPVARDGYRRELEHFVDCLETGAEPAVTPADAVDSLRLALAANRSAARGAPVSPAEVEP